jgi:hypothetical protein
MEENLPFWEMEPADELSAGGATIKVGTGKGTSVRLGPQVFAKRGQVYAVYLPTATATGTIDLTDLKGNAELRWFNPRTGAFVGDATQLAGGAPREPGLPPGEPEADWVVLIRRANRQTLPAVDTSAKPCLEQAAYGPGQDALH